MAQRRGLLDAGAANGAEVGSTSNAGDSACCVIILVVSQTVANTVPDQKERWLIARVCSTIAGGNFTECDVLTLLILLRRHAPPNSPAREFGDFIAHREKDRGILREYVDRAQRALRGETGAAVSLPVFSVLEIGTAINDLLGSFDIEPFEGERVNQIAVCIITLLQTVVVRTPLGRQIGGFGVAMSSAHIVLMGHGTVPAGHIFQYPLLIAENHGYENSLAQNHVAYPMNAEFIVSTYAENGIFRCEQTRPILLRL